MTDQEYTDYFKELAETYNPIGHVDGSNIRYYESDVEGFITDPPKTTDLLLINEAREEYLKSSNSDFYKVMSKGSILVVQHVRQGDHAARALVYSEAKGHCWEIAARMREHQENCDRVLNINLNSIMVHPAAPAYLSNYYGARMEFDMDTEKDFEITPGLWQ